METTEKILQGWSCGAEPTGEEWQALLEVELADGERAAVFGIDRAEGLERIAARSQVFHTLYPHLARDFPHLFPLALPTLWSLWLPLALDLKDRRDCAQRPFIQGILGMQGTGKTTLAAILKSILDRWGYPTLSLSLDDLYKTHAERQQLQRQEPRLQWRGPPGTHDLELGIDLLDRARRAEFPLSVPRFDKSAYNGSGDRAAPEIVARAKIVLFEGWCVGMRPIDDRAFDTAPMLDDREFARTNNQHLRAYLPLWQRLDRLWVLYPLDYRWSYHWRLEAEQQLRASGKPGMADAQIEEFVNYFWQSLHPELFIPPLLRMGGGADLAIAVNRDRVPVFYRSCSPRSELKVPNSPSPKNGPHP